MKKIQFKHQLSKLLGIALLLFITTSALSVALGETTAALWQGDKKGVVSITLDDGFRSQMNNAFPILQEHGFKATFNIVSSYIGSDPASYMDANDILVLAGDGQEIGSQTVTHSALTGLPYDELINELSQSQLYLQQLTGQKVETIAYPYGAYDVNVINAAKNYYIAARSTDSLVLNSSSPASDQFYKLYAIGPHDTYGSGDANAIAGLQYWTDRAISEKKWAIEIFHSIGIEGGYDTVSSEAFDAHLDYLAANEPNLWVAPVGTVSEYIYERNAAVITTVYQDSNSLRLELSCGLDSRFNTPLTLMTLCPEAWVGNTVYASQNQTPLTALIVSKDSNYYIMYDALPDAGLIELWVDEAVPFTTVALWQGDKKGVVSITLDDGLPSQVQNGLPILQQHGFKATFYVMSASVQENPAPVLTLAEAGQEIASHTINHPYLTDLSYDELINQLSASQLYLQQLTGQKVETIAYPYGAYDANVIDNTKNYYIAARSANSGVLNSSSPSSDLFYKLYAIGPHDTYGPGDANAVAGLQYWADRAVSEKKWAIELFHSIGIEGGYDTISSEAFGTHLDYLTENEPNLWVAPVGTVSEYIYERNAAVITALAEDSNFLRLQLQCGLDNRFNTPLTLLTHCPEAWVGKNIQAKQEQTPLTALIVFKDNDYYIMYNAVPDSGIIELWVDKIELEHYTIIASSDANGFIDPNGEILKDHGSSQLFTASANIGYEVNEWFLDGNSVQTGGTSYTLNDIIANHIISVSFKKIIYTITSYAGANGYVDPNGEILRAYGSSQLFTATPDKDYEVDQWLLDGNSIQTGGTSYTLSDISANHIIEVSFKYLITLDTSSSARTSASFLHTVPDGNNRLLLVSVMFEGDDSVSSITYAGNDLTRAVAIASGAASGCGVEIWYLAAPPVGTTDIIVNFATSVDPSGITAVNLTDVYQASPIGAAAGASAASNKNVTTDITTLHDGSFIFGAATGHGADTSPYTPGTGIIELWDNETGTSNSSDAGLWGGKLAAPTAGTYTFSTTANVGDDWAIAAIEIKSASAILPQYALSINIAGNGSVTKEPNLAIYDTGTVVSLTANPAAGWLFNEWSGDLTGSTNPTTITMNGNKNVTATFILQTFTITASAGANGSINPSGDIVKEYGSSLAFTAAADTGFEVDIWTVDGNSVQIGGTGYILSSITANHTVSVSFKSLAYTINASAGANGSINPSGDIVKEYGSSLAFTAAADTGFEVDTWTVDGNSVQTGGATYTLTNITADHSVAVSFKPLTYIIFGYVKEPDGNTPVEGVLLSTNDANSITDSNGFYLLSVSFGWSGTVVPIKDSYIFEPNINIYTNVTHDYNDVNYTAALKTFRISGHVLGLDKITPISDVNISAENDGGPWTSKYGGGSSITDVNGYYQVMVDCNWSGKVTAAKYAYAFEPNSIGYINVLADYNDQDYTGNPMTFVISGYITNDCNIPVKNVLVSADNGGNSVITDSNGFYEVWVPYLWSGTVTPSKPDWTFEPAGKVYANVLTDQQDQNYSAASIYDMDCDGRASFGDMVVIISSWLDETPGNICDFNGDGIVNLKDYAEFANFWSIDQPG